VWNLCQYPPYTYPLSERAGPLFDILFECLKVKMVVIASDTLEERTHHHERPGKIFTSHLQVGSRLYMPGCLAVTSITVPPGLRLSRRRQHETPSPLSQKGLHVSPRQTPADRPMIRGDRDIDQHDDTASSCRDGSIQIKRRELRPFISISSFLESALESVLV
jgi:hypothetical protein